MVVDKVAGKSVVLVNNQKVYKDAFTNAQVRLYLPTDQLGNVVQHDKAVRLECWTVGEVRNARIPTTMTSSNMGIAHALLKLETDHEFSSLPRSVAFASIGAMEQWLHLLVRTPEGDMNPIVIYSNPGAK